MSPVAPSPPSPSPSPPPASSLFRGALFHGASAAIVAVFCYATASRLPFLHDPFWAPIAAIVVLYPGRGETQKASGARFIGTGIGCVIGWGCASWWHGNVLLYGAGVLVAVAVCYLLRLENAARLCAVSVTAITLIARSEPPSTSALYRFIEVSYGVACALAYSALADAVKGRWEAKAR